MKHLKEYLRRTAQMRKGQSKLLLCYRKPFGRASKATISRWAKSVLEAAGIDVGVYKAHSSRAASTSHCVAKGLSLEEIMTTAGWSNAGTFARFYQKPLDENVTNFSKTAVER